MKKIYFLIVFLLITTISQSQNYEGTPVKEVIQIYRTEQQSENLTSKSTVVSNSQVMTALTPTGSSTEAGLTAGQLSVSLDGAANYMLPVIVPPGINGVEPKVGLVYSSQASDGMAANE